MNFIRSIAAAAYKSQKERLGMRIGISTYTFTWAVGINGCPQPKKPLTSLDLLEKAKELGVDLVQICDNLPLHKKSKPELVEIAARASDMGIGIEVGTRGVEPGHLLKYLKIAKIMHSRILRTMISPVEGIIPAPDQVIEWISEVIPEFAQAGVSIAIENYERVKTGELKRIIEKVGSSFVGVCLDTVNSFGALECPDQVVKDLAQHTINLHVKDFDIKRVQHQLGFSVTGCPAGEGRLDMDKLLDSLRQNGKDPSVILELWTPFSQDIENTISIENQWAVKSIKYLKEKVI